MERMDVLSKLQEIVIMVFNNKDLLIEEETVIKELEIWDSLLHMQLIVALEKEFGIKFKLAELPLLTDVKSIVDVIISKLDK